MSTTTTTTTTTEPITAENVHRLFPDVNTTLANSHRTPTDHNDLTGYDEEQIRLMDEVCIVLDNDDNPIGSASKKTCSSFLLNSLHFCFLVKPQANCFCHQAI
jgi:isopentenyl-diphosphate Delta-isomerase